ncbi:MAG: hypothetical protein CO140_03295 [Candidatus Moranbacteria bacterium CG_4_9_14_3_um_filter_40_7]|nr:MAG: hypothetical protein CO140_03295 [Candidatus Moranbacteria bacterium CG_4_9_14_3_um_filter_40_7]
MIEIKIIKKSAIFLLIGAFLFCAISVLSAQAQEAPEDLFRIPGIIEGTGKNFAITDSEYLNISLTSSEDITAGIESAPEMIVMDIRASNESYFSNFILSGLSANTTYHKYQDDYHNYAPLISDENGKAFFVQDVSQDHLVFIQPRKSTKYINSITGGDCGSIGNWNADSKTCTLNTDVNDTIQIDSDGITLDGNGHKVIGTGTGYGITTKYSQYIIKNLIVSGFLRGIFVRKSGSIISNTVTGNSYGIYMEGANPGVNISNNSVSANTINGIYLYNTKNNIISNNIIGPDNWVGLFQTSSDYNTYENNDLSGNQMGAVLYGNHNILRGNTLYDNSESNFYIKSSDMMTNDIGIDNTIDGKPIYYEKNVSNKTYDDSMNAGAFYCVHCENIILKNVSLADKRAQMVFWHTDNSLVEGLTSEDKSITVALDYATNNIIRKNTFNWIKVAYGSGNNIYNNNIMSPDMMTSIYPSFGSLFYQPLPIGGNYWKRNEARCKDINNDKICDDQFFFDGETDIYPWAQEFDFNTPSCCSSVMFLPGIKASRLYKKDGGSEDQLWEPNYFGNDLEDLALSESGESINDVYTKDIIEEAGLPIIGGNIYKTFVDKLEALKNDGAINDYNLFAYDWRKSVEDVAQSGTLYFDGAMKLATAELKNLAENSQNKKVTIIAHSNGGLLAKAIMQELEKSGEAGKVDKIILVGTPQMGTPLAILSMLYGYDESALFGTLISQSEARTLAENMPGAYGLLPSEKYLERMEEPFISFSSENTRYKDFKDVYGENIDSFDELRKFLTGEDDGREKPDADEIDLENVLNENILDEAVEMHQRLDEWTPPSNVEVMEIAGWGLDTVSGVDYTEKEKMDCYASPGFKIPSCIGIGEYEPVYEPQFTVDGDKVVVAPSALMLPESVKKYWVDLYNYNDNNISDRKHSNILEMNPLQQFLSDIIENKDNSLPEYIETSRPDDYENAKPRIRMSLYSPLDIHLKDSAGNKTGPEIIDGHTIIKEEIPNSYYYQFGERKYIGFPGGENIQVVMNGYALGSYTLQLEEVKITEEGDEVIAHTVFTNLPTTADTTVSFNIPETGLADMTTLKADMDSDGVNEYEINKILNGTAVPIVTIETISNNVDHLAKLGFITDVKTQNFLQVKIRELSHAKDMIEKMDSKDNKNPKANQIKLFNKKIDDLIRFIENKFPQTILSPAKETLIKNLESIKIK